MNKLIAILTLCISLNSVGQNIDFILYSKNTMNGTKYGAISLTGDTFLRAEFEEVGKFNGKNFAVKKNAHWGIVDTNNKVLIPHQYDYLTNLKGGVFFGGKGSKAALIDSSNKQITAYIYDNVWNFSEGIAKVKIGSKIGYINKQGFAVIPIKFLNGSDYCEFGKVTVNISNWNDLGTYKLTYFNGQSVAYDAGYSNIYSIVMNKQGKVIYRGNTDGEEIIFLPNDFIIMKKYGAPGCNYGVAQLMDSKGKATFSYNNCCEFYEYNDSSITIYSRNQNQFGAITYEGKELLKTNFKEISRFIYDSKKLAKVTFDDGGFFYADQSFKCVEYNKTPCPE